MAKGYERARDGCAVDPFLLGLLLALVAAAADVLGGVLSVSRGLRGVHLPRLLAFAAGFILAVTLLERIPHATEELEGALLWVLGGYLVLYLAENVFAYHAHHGEGHAHGGHPLLGGVGTDEPFIAPHAGYAAFVGLGIHAFFDGAAIVAGFLVSPAVGALLFAAVFLHKVPEGLSIGSIALASGGSRHVALFTAGVLGASTVAGAVAAGLLGVTDARFVDVFLALASGSFLYVATTDLVPAANESGKRSTAAFLFAGVALFFVSEWLLGRAGFAL